MGFLATAGRGIAFIQWRDTVVRSILVFLLVISNIEGQEDIVSLCRNTASSQSCGECIKRDPRCAWCTDPAFSGDFRCDVETNLAASCTPQFIYQAKSGVKVTENAEAGTYDPQHGKILQIQPQQVHALIKPGETVAFPLKYYHAADEERDVYILNSETESQGVSLAYSVNCKGVMKHDRSCSGVRNSDLIVYNVSITLRDCKSTAVVSIGLSGVREVLALYVHPQCGCDCEQRQEPKSNHCNGMGTLICGACLCDDPSKGGRHCECDLAPGQTTAQIEQSCRSEPHKPLCNDHGYCNCGTCVCDPPNQFSGKFCECPYAACPAGETNGLPCGGRGTCHCGTCACEPGWSGPACTCSTDTDDCLSHEKLCTGGGTCICNKCKCFQGFSGERCEFSKPTDIHPGGHVGEGDVTHPAVIPWPEPPTPGPVPEEPTPQPEPEPEPEQEQEQEQDQDQEQEPKPEPESEHDPQPEPEPTGDKNDLEPDHGITSDESQGEYVPEPEPSAGAGQETDNTTPSGASKATTYNLLPLFAVVLLGFVYRR